MANPASIGVNDPYPAVLVITDTKVTVDLDPKLEYMLYHDREDSSGSSSGVTVYMTFHHPNVDNDPSEGANKAKLIDGRELPIGPGVGRAMLQTATGEATVTVAPNPVPPVVHN